MQLALELYFDFYKEYPEGGYSELKDTLVGEEFISALPKDPLGEYYKYDDCNSGEGYHLGASLEQQSSALNDDSDDSCGDWGADNKACFGTDGIQQGSKCYDVTD